MRPHPVCFISSITDAFYRYRHHFRRHYHHRQNRRREKILYWFHKTLLPNWMNFLAVPCAQ